MNRPIERTEIEKQAREAAAEEFALAAFYGNLIAGHLQVGDDSGALWTMELFKGAGRRAFAAFTPVRAAIIERGRQAKEGSGT